MRLSLRAEILKLTRQRASLFWGFLLVPALTTFISAILFGAGPPPGGGITVIVPLHSAARALNAGGNPIAQLFFAIGAAAIFAVEYRYSGWRHLVPRASRASLLLSKFAAFALFAALSLLLVIFGDLLVSTALPLARGAHPVIADISRPSMTLLALAFLVSLAELLVLSALVALVAVATRSAMGAIIAPFLLSLAASLVESWLAGAGGDIPLPTFAADALRIWLTGGGTAHSALIGALVLAVWLAAAAGLAIALFARQDLVSE